MINRIKEILEFGSTNGYHTAAAYDADKKGPSTTLMFANTAHYLTIIIIAALAFKDLENAATAAILYSIITMILYMMRRLTKVELDVDDRSVKLDSGEKDE